MGAAAKLTPAPSPRAPGPEAAPSRGPRVALLRPAYSELNGTHVQNSCVGTAGGVAYVNSTVTSPAEDATRT